MAIPSEIGMFFDADIVARHLMDMLPISCQQAFDIIKKYGEYAEEWYSKNSTDRSCACRIAREENEARVHAPNIDTSPDEEFTHDSNGAA